MKNVTCIGLLLVFGCMICSCASLNYAGKQWVEGNVLYSTKLPSLKLTVRDDFSYHGEEELNRPSIHISGPERKDTLNSKIFLFASERNVAILVVKIHSLSIQNNNSIVEPDYSDPASYFRHGKEELSGRFFRTGISVEENGKYTFLKKSYGKVFAQTFKLLIHYMEIAPDQLRNKLTHDLTHADQVLIDEFNKRAVDSFQTTKFDQ